MKDYLQGFRAKIEKCWDDKTISPKFLPRVDGQTKSAGQCTVTSCVLLEQLRRDFADKDFTLAVGQVRQGSEVIIDFHIWVVEIAERSTDNMIIDVTADQSHRLPEVVYEKVTDLANKNVYYIAQEQSHSGKFLHSEARKRVQLLAVKFES